MFTTFKQLHLLGLLPETSFLFVEKIFVALRIGRQDDRVGIITRDELFREIFFDSDFAITRNVPGGVDDTEAALTNRLAD